MEIELCNTDVCEGGADIAVRTERENTLCRSCCKDINSRGTYCFRYLFIPADIAFYTPTDCR